MTLDECVALDARIGDLKREAQAVEPVPGFCAEESWHHGFKRRVKELVGFRRLEPGETAYPYPQRGGAHKVGEIAKIFLEEITDRRRRIESGELHLVEDLYSTQAYDGVCQGLYSLLPSCNHEKGACRF
jgi:hypothetical protein